MTVIGLGQRGQSQYARTAKFLSPQSYSPFAAGSLDSLSSPPDE